MNITYLFYLIIYIIVINLIGFLIMFIDKKKAIKGSFRVSEKGIFTIAILLGGIGVYLGMYKFRHKTKHTLFTVGIPICIILNILSCYYIVTTFLIT